MLRVEFLLLRVCQANEMPVWYNNRWVNNIYCGRISFLSILRRRPYADMIHLHSLTVHDSWKNKADGKTIKGDGTECFESPEQGVKAFVSGSEVDPIVVWDPDAPCPGSDASYIHYTAKGSVASFEPMTAGAGSLVHTYKAAVFQSLPLDEGTSGCVQNFSPTTGLTCLKTWQVARYGSTCPDTRAQRGSGLGVPFVLLFGVVLTAVAWKRRQQLLASCRSRRSKIESYIALSTVAPS